MYAFMFMTLPVSYHLHTAIEAGGDVLRHAVYPRLRGKNKHIAVVSRWQRENVSQRWGISADVISLLPNYPDRMVRMCSRRDIILTAGRFHWSKNHRMWMQAGLKMQDMLERHGMEMLWCTPFLDDEGRAMTQDLPPRLRVAVITEQSELDGYFSRAAVYYQPSVVEMQGIAVLEAMQNGIPSVVTADTGMTDAVVDGETGIVVPQGDVAAHVAALQLLLDTPTLAERYGHAARALVAERYTARRWADTLHELMNSISVFDGESR
jgi:glycosyltransferase involved in cell wall biosynthesis